eukprot:2272025-Heterocapsa_arctica.AAC.1
MYVNLLRLKLGLSSSEFMQKDQRVVRNPTVTTRGPAGRAQRSEQLTTHTHALIRSYTQTLL